jgi:hypothetical protein
MANYAIVLTIEVDEQLGDPGNWDWVQLLDTGLSAECQLSAVLLDDPTHDEIDNFRSAVGAFQDAIFKLERGDL